MQADVLILGAGPAGSALARQLAGEGFSVVIADKKAFPRQKPCGEFLSPECLPYLAELGLGGMLEELGAQRVLGMRLSGYGRTADGSFRQLDDRPGHGRSGYGIRRERFDTAIHRAIEFLDLLQWQSTLRPSVSAPTTIEIQSGAKILPLPLAGITHVQGLKDYAIIHTAERRHVVRMTMKNLEQLLAPHGFARVHKSFIVAEDKLPLMHRNKIEFDGFQVPVGRRFRSGGGGVPHH